MVVVVPSYLQPHNTPLLCLQCARASRPASPPVSGRRREVPPSPGQPRARFSPPPPSISLHPLHPATVPPPSLANLCLTARASHPRPCFPSQPPPCSLTQPFPDNLPQLRHTLPRSPPTIPPTTPDTPYLISFPTQPCQPRLPPTHLISCVPVSHYHRLFS
ncbi:hypothetical protein E2C01_076552 [Portunus trituberculatus]|uniref:Uncharacterized protein n=1 Tax=Portunus trituberculatus TaxID=210409 RepID=A0A5B7IHY3_PORTR|nr:hypothetical protein [Portunus trituberculatus]